MTLENDELADPTVVITMKGKGPRPVTVVTPLKGLKYGDIARISRSDDPWKEILPFVTGQSYMDEASSANHAKLLAATREKPATALLYGTGANGLLMARLPLPDKNEMRELFQV